jgi:hypothetical protein
MEFKVTIHYVKPCNLGGIQSGTQVHYVNASSEDEAEKTAIRLGVNDPAYLYRNMVDVERNFSPNSY